MAFDRPVVIDACCLINLHATGRLGELLRAIPQPTLVTETVRALELLQVERLDALNPEGQHLQDLIERGDLRVVDFDSDMEATRFLAYAGAIQDGEASSLAIAAMRGYAVATDDRKARNFALRQIPDVPLVYTLEVMQYWSDSLTKDAQVVRQALEQMSTHARYRPPRSHPLYSWWIEVTSLPE